MLCKIV